MALKYWPLGLALLVALAAVGYLWWRRTAPRPGGQGPLVANTDNVRRTPRFQTLARSLLRWTAVQVASLALVVTGCWLLASRLGLADESTSVQHNRDVMLCLDVSGSMRQVDADLLAAFADITKQLKGERVGLTIWNSSAVMKFPLTNDYDFVAARLAEGAEALRGMSGVYTVGTSEGSGASLIGDGIVSCLQRFDRLDTQRARTMILATDNDLSGTPIYTTDQAFEQIRQQKVVVFTLAEYESDDYTALRRLATDTGGAGYLLRDKGSGAQVVRSIQSMEAARLQGERQVTVTDLSAVGLSLVSLGLLGWLVASRKVGR